MNKWIWAQVNGWWVRQAPQFHVMTLKKTQSLAELPSVMASRMTNRHTGCTKDSITEALGAYKGLLWAAGNDRTAFVSVCVCERDRE